MFFQSFILKLDAFVPYSLAPSVALKLKRPRDFRCLRAPTSSDVRVKPLTMTILMMGEEVELQDTLHGLQVSCYYRGYEIQGAKKKEK